MHVVGGLERRAGERGHTIESLQPKATSVATGRGDAVRRATEVRPDVDDELLALLARVRPSLLELVSLWPVGQQRQLALFIGTAPSGDAQIRARLRGDRGDERRESTGGRARSRDDLPVTFELGDGRTIVLRLAAVLAQCIRPSAASPTRTRSDQGY
jgi:hypothetical protein